MKSTRKESFKMSGFDKPATLIEAAELQRILGIFGLEVPQTIDNDRHLRAEKFASRIATILARVPDRNNAHQAYCTFAAFAYASDAEIVNRAV
jgi:hypothetical protein